MTDPITIAASLSLICLLGAWLLLRRRPRDSEPDARPRIWREIRLFPDALATPRARGELVAEEDEGVELYLVHARPRKCWTFHAHAEAPDRQPPPAHGNGDDGSDGNGDHDGDDDADHDGVLHGDAEAVELASPAHGDAPVKIELRGRGLWKRRYLLEFDGQTWVELQAPRRSDEGFRLQFARSGQKLKVEGRPADGEYEIRRADRLAALVARVDPHEASGNGSRRSGTATLPNEWSLQVRLQEDVTRITALALAVAALDGGNGKG